MKRKIYFEQLRLFKKSFFTLNDLVKIFNIEKNSLKIALNRWVKNGKILRLRNNTYILPDKISNVKKIASELYQPCYLSFESALNEYGILNQIPYTLAFATINKPKKIRLAGQEIEFRQIKKELFFGYELYNGLFIASPEKSLADQLYFISKGLASLNYGELDLKNISLKKFLSIIKLYPKSTQKIAEILKFNIKYVPTNQ